MSGSSPEINGRCVTRCDEGYQTVDRGGAPPRTTRREPTMGIGVSVFLLALGAILAFAVHFSVSGLDINVIGYILMAAGAIGLLMTSLVFGRRDRGIATTGVVTEERVVRDPGTY